MLVNDETALKFLKFGIKDWPFRLVDASHERRAFNGLYYYTAVVNEPIKFLS